jgi:hypothetical protein
VGRTVVYALAKQLNKEWDQRALETAHPTRQRVWRKTISNTKGESMKIQVRRLAIALAIASPLAVAVTAKSFAAPINGTPVKASAPTVTTDVRYRVYWDYAYPSYSGYPAYYYYGDPDYWTYSPYWSYPRYYSYSWW